MPVPTEEAAVPAATGPCPTRESEVEAWIDRLQRGVYKSVCVSAYRFDSLFGGSRVDYERSEPFGRVGLIAVWDEKDGYDYDARFKARYRLPRLERRIDAVLGRTSEDEFLRGRESQLDFLPDAFAETDAEWLAGLGYAPVRNSTNLVDFNVGVNIEVPLEPYFNTRYRRNLFFGDRSLLRFQEILFWRSEKGYGTTTRLDVDRVLTRSSLLRWASSATWSQSTEGVDWVTWLTAYQRIGRARAVALQAEYRGATDAEVPVRQYGGRAILRHQVWREWLFLEARAGLLWRRDLRHEERDATPELGFGFEMKFGQDGPGAPAPPPREAG